MRLAEARMLPIQEWFSDRNLQKSSGGDVGRRLEGEALTYALVTFLVRPGRLPEDVVVTLAEEHFAQMSPGVEA